MTGLLVDIGGEHLPLEKCDWVLWARCGCPVGVTVGATRNLSIIQATEESAWKAFYERKREREAAQRAGLRVELMSHKRYGDEVLPHMTGPCPHKGGQS